MNENIKTTPTAIIIIWNFSSSFVYTGVFRKSESIILYFKICSVVTRENFLEFNNPEI